MEELHDDLIETLLDNIDLIEEFDDEMLSDTASSTDPSTFVTSPSSCDDGHVVYFKKRKYERYPTEEEQRPLPLSKRSNRRLNPKSQQIVLPRILKHDIRRKYLLMYANVMNSYDYNLIVKFFHQFMQEDLQFEKQHPSPTDSFHVLLQGVTKVTEYFLLLLQSSPDKITRISDVQLKQSSSNIERTEISCKFFMSNTKCYDVFPGTFVDLISDESLAPYRLVDQSPESNEITTKKRKANDALSPHSLHQYLFDPIDGIFIKSRFKRSENPFHFTIEGSLSFIINEQKRIERIIIKRGACSPPDLFVGCCGNYVSTPQK